VQEKYIQEDEIDLRELFKILWNKRFFIISFTAVITICSIVYALLKTPIYEAKVLFEIGEYKLDNSTSNSKVLLDNASQLTKRLEVLYIDMVKNLENQGAVITSVSVPKGLTNFIEVKVEGISNELLLQKMDEIKNYIQQEHQNTLNDVKQRREVEIQNIDTRISNIKNKEVVLIDRKIELQKKNLEDYSVTLEAIDKSLKNIQNINPSLAALQLMQKRDLSNFILTLNMQIFEMENKKDELETTVINKLIEDKNLLQSMLLPHNYRNTQIVGDVAINNNPIKPKKSLTVIVACITGFIVSIFLVFIMQFIQNFRGEKND